MRLSRLNIQNFRGITQLDLDLDQTTVLIGENNTGKTSVLEALNTCMNRGLPKRALPFGEYDFYMGSQGASPESAPPILITMTFEEESLDQWPDAISQVFSNVVQVLDDGRQQIIFRVKAEYDKSTNDFVVEWIFLNTAGAPLQNAKNPQFVYNLQQFAPVFFLSAIRDASQQFSAKSSFWGPFTKNLQISDERRQDLEQQIEQINQSVLDSHQPFEVVKERLAQTGKLLPLATDNLVSVEAIPARIFDMLAKTQVKIASRTGARLPITQHGAGTQSLSVLFLFEAFLQSRLAETHDKHSEPILALEEPETHLHPSAIRSLWSTLDKLAGQKIIATRSGELLSAVPLKAIRRLSRRNAITEVFQLKPGTLTEAEIIKVSYHVRANRGSLLFARCWLLVEGQSDFFLLPELARILGIDFNQCGISCVEFAQFSITPLVKLANDLGIEWHVLTDGDVQGKKYANQAVQLLGNDAQNERISTLSEDNIEHCLWKHGYQDVYKRSVNMHRKKIITAPSSDESYIQQTIDAACKSFSKPLLAYEVISEIEKRGSSGVPPVLAEAIQAAVSLAGKCS